MSRNEKNPNSGLKIIKAELYFEVEGQFDPSMVKEFLVSKLESPQIRKAMSLHRQTEVEETPVEYFKLPKSLEGVKRIKAITRTEALNGIK